MGDELPNISRSRGSTSLPLSVAKGHLISEPVLERSEGKRAFSNAGKKGIISVESWLFRLRYKLNVVYLLKFFISGHKKDVVSFGTLVSDTINVGQIAFGVFAFHRK